MSTIRKDNESPFKIWQAIGGLVGGLYTGIQAGKAAKKAEKAEKKARKERDAARRDMRNIDMSNPFEGMQNQFAGMENKMEDLTINQKEAQFAAQQFAQSQSNIMSGLRGAAGGSGIAALAQSLAQQGQLAAQKSAAGIGQQEAANQAKMAQEASNIQLKERAGAAQVAQQIAAGEAASQTRELQKQQAIFNDASAEYRAAQGTAAAAQAQKDQAWGGVIEGGVSAIGSLVTGGV
tara:strand:+ start:6266 stop:6970 length:705 start_codon:yes stop_codon:yes gene_type:complete